MTCGMTHSLLRPIRPALELGHTTHVGFAHQPQLDLRSLVASTGRQYPRRWSTRWRLRGRICSAVRGGKPGAAAALEKPTLPVKINRRSELPLWSANAAATASPRRPATIGPCSSQLIQRAVAAVKQTCRHWPAENPAHRPARAPGIRPILRTPGGCLGNLAQ